MNVKLWYCKKLTKKIGSMESRRAKFISMANKIRSWIKRDKKRLATYLQQLSVEDNIKYGFQMGFMDNAEYQIMLSNLGVKNEKAKRH